MQNRFAKGTRYKTQRIETEMPIPLQVFLWQCIDDWQAEGVKLDRLQVFKFERIADGLYAIRHEQEQPNKATVYYLSDDLGIASVVGKNVFVIDDGDYSTMLFAEEY